MANVKFIAVSRGLRGIVDYVTNREKTVEQLISGVNCVARTAVPEFEAVKKQFRKTEGRGYYHIVQAFAPDDPLDFATAHELGVKLAEHFKGVSTLSVASTAESARMAAGDTATAGICNPLAARLHGARVVAESIQDNPENQTAFALVGRLVDAELLRGSRYKTSLALFLRADKPGALQMILSEFAYAGINLTMLQSRPTKKQLGDYMFFVELDGSMHDIDVQTALDCLRLKLREVKVLGSYPVE